MKFVTFDTDEHADAFLALMRRLENERSGFWQNRGFILGRFRDVVIATGDDDRVLGFYISKDGPDGSRIVEIIQAFDERKGLGTLMLEDLCERYEPDHLLCFEPLTESIGFWKRAGVRAIDRRKRVWSL